MSATVNANAIVEGTPNGQGGFNDTITLDNAASNVEFVVTGPVLAANRRRLAARADLIGRLAPTERAARHFGVIPARLCLAYDFVSLSSWPGSTGPPICSFC